MALKITITFLVVSLTASSTTLRGQDNQPPKSRFFNLGLMTGVNLSSFSERIGEFGDGANEKYDEFVRISPILGLHSRFQISKAFALRTELLFNMRGGSYRAESSVISIGGNGDANYHYKNYRLNYFEIPLLAEVDFMGKKYKDKLHIRLAGGVSYGINVASSLRYNGYAPTGTSSGPLVDVEEKFDVVKAEGAQESILNTIVELSFDFVNGHDTPLFVKLRYNGSLDEVYDSVEPTSYNSETKMNTWSLIFGFRFLRN